VDRAVTKKVEQWAKSSENGPRVKAVMKELKANQASKYSSPSSSSSSSSSSSPFKWFDQEDSASSSSPSLSSSSSSAPSDLFAGLVFSFSEHFAFKRKSELTDQIKRHGGTISYMLNDRCTHLVATPKEVADNLSGKIRQARKFVEEGKRPAARAGGDDVFHVIAGEWLDECLRQGVRVKEYPAFDLLAQLRLGASKVCVKQWNVTHSKEWNSKNAHDTTRTPRTTTGAGRNRWRRRRRANVGDHGAKEYALAHRGLGGVRTGAYL
jgi:hypothetical protein